MGDITSLLQLLGAQGGGAPAPPAAAQPPAPTAGSSSASTSGFAAQAPSAFGTYSLPMILWTSMPSLPSLF